ncbi:TAPT1-like [Homarus americanus]|uniref:TAPT1-like n=1 Tax=Homarus americanus TaxID=6706 RepID=A0A8J5JLE2_HOMAM|nr:TAPT1-like [Homarus americanus]
MADKSDMVTHTPILEAELNSLRGLSFRDYLKSELRRGYLLENDEERYTARREKVYTFFKIPREIEKFVAYGFFQCADSFFFVFTFLPIRFFLAIWSLLTRPIRKLFGFYFNKNRRILKPAEIVDLLKGVMVLVCCYIMGYIDTSVCYHIIKTQSTIKLYLFFNMLEIADRLMSAFGQDTLDALFWTATEPRGRKREHFGVLFHLLVAIAYVAMHSTIVLLQALTLNVAINSDNKGLLTIVISNNGAVFKKFDRNNLLQISCSDVRERFHNCVLLLVVVIQTMKEYAWKEERLWILLPDCLLVCGTEILVDWLKHAFITRFNDIPADAYKDYTVLLASDLIMCKQKYAYSDHSDLVARRMGFIPLPLGVVMYRILSQSIHLSNPASYLILVFGFFCLLSFRVLNGVIILGKACDLIESAEKRRARNESTSESVEKKKSSSSDSMTSEETCSKEEPIKVEAATSPIRGWSLPPQPSPMCEKLPCKAFTPTPEMTTPASASIVSTPSSSAAPPRSNSLDFFGESKKGLMANSMVNLSSVGINEGPFTSDASRQYLLQHSLESIVSAENSDAADSSFEQIASVPATPGLLPTTSEASSNTDDQTEHIQAITPSPASSQGESLFEIEAPSEMKKIKRPPFLTCDSLRYRGSTDAGDLL